MRAQEASEAFSQWVALRKLKNIKGCIHHTDGGSQYFSNLYIKRMNEAKLKISVASNCLANGYAEQRNGLLKHHLIPTITMTKGSSFETQIADVIKIYNFERKQEGLKWRSPCEFERDLRTTESNISKTLYDRSKHINTIKTR